MITILITSNGLRHSSSATFGLIVSSAEREEIKYVGN